MKYPFGQLPCSIPSQPHVHPHPTGFSLERQPWCCVSILPQTQRAALQGLLRQKSIPPNRARQEASIHPSSSIFLPGKNSSAAAWKLLKKNATLSTAEASFSDGQSGLLSCSVSTHHLASRLKNKQTNKQALEVCVFPFHWECDTLDTPFSCWKVILAAVGSVLTGGYTSKMEGCTHQIGCNVIYLK